MNTAGVYGYGLEFRTRIVDLVLGGASPEEAVHHFSVHVDTVKRYLERHHNNTLHVRVKPTGRHRTVTAAHEDQLLKQLETHPDATLTEHARMLEEATGLQCQWHHKTGTVAHLGAGRSGGRRQRGARRETRPHSGPTGA